MIGRLSPTPVEPAGIPRLPVVLGLLGFGFLAFFAALALIDRGSNHWALALLGIFGLLVAGAAGVARLR